MSTKDKPAVAPALCVLGLLIVGLGLVAAYGQSPGDPLDLTWHSLDSGGATHSAGGDFTLFGAIGKPDAAQLSGDGYQLTGGFWFETPPGDCNSDGCTDLIEFASFRSCLTGPGAEIAAGCRCFDSDNDGDVDLTDVAAFQASFNRGG